MARRKFLKEDPRSSSDGTKSTPTPVPGKKQSFLLEHLVTQLQQTVGNRSTLTLMQGGIVQAKLQVGSPNDRYEQEADRIAEKVVGGNDIDVQRKLEEEQGGVLPVQRSASHSPLVQRKTSDNAELEEDEEEEETPLQAKPLDAKQLTPAQGVEDQIQNAKGKEQSLSVAERMYFESRFGRDFSGIRVHTGAAADTAAKSLNARAFTTGSDIYFSSGRYPPKSDAGQRLLAHELTHTIQQNAVPETTGGMAAGQQASVPSVQTLREAKSATIQRSALGVVGGLLGGALAGAALGALVGGGIGAVVGGLFGGLVGGILGGFFSGKKGKKKAAATYKWKDKQLKAKVDGSDTAEDIQKYIDTLDDKKKAIAIVDLEQGRVDYVNRNADKDAIAKMSKVLQAIYLKVAKEKAPGKVAPEGGWPAGGEPPELLKGTGKLKKGEKKEIKEALKIKVEKDPVTGEPKKFVSKIKGKGKYEDRIRPLVEDNINYLYDKRVKDKGPAERAISGKLHLWPRLKEVANVAKTETDKVFQSFTRGKELKPGTNLFDRWEKIEAQLATATPQQKEKIARHRVWKILINSRSIRDLHKDHNAIPSRTDVAPGEAESENTILLRIRDDFAAKHEKRLLEIHRGWGGAARGGKIYLQRFKKSSDLLNRWMFWDLFQTMIHEYLHTVTHKKYYKYVYDNYGHGSEEYYTLIEGVNSLMTEIAWKNVKPHTKDKKLREKVEGVPYANLPFEPKTVPDIKRLRYPTYDRATEVVKIAGINNVYAAYFLGKVKLIGG